MIHWAVLMTRSHKNPSIDGNADLGHNLKHPRYGKESLIRCDAEMGMDVELLTKVKDGHNESADSNTKGMKRGYNNYITMTQSLHSYNY
jgi:hypothetical protein